ncbi:MAG TPA: hypothetical protein VFZ52_18070 [Chryseolinea sp.]
MTALNISLKNITRGASEPLARATDCREELVSRVYAGQVRHLFNYGMNACGDERLVKTCISDVFLLIAERPKALGAGKFAEANILKMFRRHLIRMIAFAGEDTISDVSKNLFPATLETTNGPTNVQREALFLKFQRGFSYYQVATIMNLSPEQVRNEISYAADFLLHQKGLNTMNT